MLKNRYEKNCEEIENLINTIIRDYDNKYSNEYRERFEGLIIEDNISIERSLGFLRELTTKYLEEIILQLGDYLKCFKIYPHNEKWNHIKDRIYYGAENII